MNYVSAKEAKNHFMISSQTLKNWKDSKKIKTKVFSSKKILYDIDSLNSNNEENDTRKNVIYARVSSTSQKASLLNQIDLIKKYMISNGIIVDDIYSEIASGLNDNRKELNRLLYDISQNKIKCIYISFKDRLSRFGFNYFKTIFKNYNVEIKILDENQITSKEVEQELTEDLISIIHQYSNKLYSNKRKKLKQIEENLKDIQKS